MADFLPQPQRGYIFEMHGAWHIRFYIHSDGKRKQRSRKLCVKDDLHPSKTSHSVLKLAEDFMLKIIASNVGNDLQIGHSCPVCGNRCKRTLAGTFAPRV